jgi:hypothetical protein
MIPTAILVSQVDERAKDEDIGSNRRHQEIIAASSS